MIFEAQRDHRLDLARSYFVGDKSERHRVRAKCRRANDSCANGIRRAREWTAALTGSRAISLMPPRSSSGRADDTLDWRSGLRAGGRNEVTACSGSFLFRARLPLRSFGSARHRLQASLAGDLRSRMALRRRSFSRCCFCSNYYPWPFSGGRLLRGRTELGTILEGPAIIGGIARLVGLQPIEVYAHYGAIIALAVPLAIFALAVALFGRWAGLASLFAFLFLGPNDVPSWAAPSYSPWLFANLLSLLPFALTLIVALRFRENGRYAFKPSMWSVARHHIPGAYRRGHCRGDCPAGAGLGARERGRGRDSLGAGFGWGSGGECAASGDDSLALRSPD